jgi:hypothetical protein
VGGLYHAHRVRHAPRRHLKHLPLAARRFYYVRGQVIREPARHYRQEPFAPGNAALPQYWSLGIEVEAISPDAGMWRETSGGMAVFVGSGRPAVRVGDRVQFLARLRRNRRPSNPGERDRARTYERRGSYGVASVQSPAALRVLSRGRWHGSLRYAVAGARSFVRARLARHLSAEGPEGRWALVAALLFGERNWLTPAQERLLKESGTLHFLAISGLHVGLFCVFVAYVLTLADLPVRPRYAATIALVWLYVWFTGAHVSALRAGWMLTFMLAAPLLGRRGDSTSALAGAALVILLFCSARSSCSPPASSSPSPRCGR